MGLSKKYHTIVFGCQMNVHDSEVVASLLEGMGYIHTEDSGEADLIIVLTCCVRETAEQKVFGLLGRLRKLKKEKPGLIIGVGGCMSQQEGMGKRIKERFTHIDLVFGTHNLNRLPELIGQVAEKRGRIVEVWSSSPETLEQLPDRKVEGVRAWVCIMYGCNNFCTYCIVPYVRGRERSRDPDEVISEVKRLVNNGVKEVTLLGQNVNSYGKDFGQDIDFSDLLMMLEEVKGLERVRFMTSHPRDLSDKMISTLTQAKKVCQHVHLPVQAGSTAILRAMNRGYTREKYLELVDKLTSALPGVSLTTDIIVGFPGETEEDFRDTVDIVQKVRFDGAFIFIYNKRSGTPAADMPGQVSDEVKSQRIQELIKIQNDLTCASHEKDKGKVLEVLVEGTSKTKKDKYSGRTRTNKLVVFESSKNLTGKLVNIEITGYSLTHLEGRLV